MFQGKESWLVMMVQFMKDLFTITKDMEKENWLSGNGFLSSVGDILINSEFKFHSENQTGNIDLKPVGSALDDTMQKAWFGSWLDQHQ